LFRDLELFAIGWLAQQNGFIFVAENESVTPGFSWDARSFENAEHLQ
jgi:hypothetical protein